MKKTAHAADIIHAAMELAGYRNRQADFCRVACFSWTTFSRRIRDPDSITIGELRRIDRAARIPDNDLITLIRKGDK